MSAGETAPDDGRAGVAPPILTVEQVEQMTPAERQAAADARTVADRSELSADAAAHLLGDDDEILARLARRRARAS